MHLLKIYMRPVKNGKKVDFGIKIAIEGEIVKVQEHRKIRLIPIAI
jgi:hypothetical protein